MGGGRLRRPPLINYQFYIKKIIKIYGKNIKKCKNMQKVSVVVVVHQFPKQNKIDTAIYIYIYIYMAQVWAQVRYQ